MTKTKKLTIIFVLLASIVGLFVVGFFVLRDRTVWQSYTSEQLGFSVLIPDSWKIEEENPPSGPDIMIIDKNSLAFIRVRGMTDLAINSMEMIDSSISRYKNKLAQQDGHSVADFSTENISETVKEFTLSGEFPVNDVIYRYEERGQIATDGRVIIMRATDTPEDFTQSIIAMRKITDSFKLQ
ncbi:hypothetical protein HYV44_02255 [Candidatus Microgenomates bacterium]|nr:hypothetical protein [Candidatus Microgenomates bacterium]